MRAAEEPVPGPPRAADPLDGLARRADPADAGAQNNLGVVLARHGRAADARRAFARALALDPDMALARRNLAAASSPADATAEERALRARVRLAPADPDARRALVRHLSARGRHEAARDALARWADDAPGHAVDAERARTELAAGRPEAALEAAAAARASAPPAAHAALDVLAARALYQQGDAPAALALLDRAHAAAPDDADAALLRSFVLGETGAAADAEAARARAAALNPALGVVDGNLALVVEPPPAARTSGTPRATDAGAPDPAPQPAPNVLPAPAAPPSPAAALALARAHRHKGYLAEALEVLARTAGCDRACAREAGELLLLAGRPADAVAAWDAAHALGADDAAAWLNLGVARALGGAGGAGEAFARAAALGRGTCAEAWALAGQAHVARAAGDMGAACEALRAAAAAAREASPTGRAVLAASLARALAAVGRHAEACRAGAAGVRLAPAWAHAAAAHGEVLAGAGAHPEARAAYAAAVALAPDDAAARYGLAFAAAACGDHAAARAETARALALAPVVPSLPWPLVADVGEWLVCGADAPAAAAARASRAPLTAADAGVAEARLAALFGHAAPARSAPPAPADRPAPFAEVDALLAVGEYDRAVAATSRALARGAPRAAACARAALAFERQGYFGEAVERYAQALEAGSAAASAPDPTPPVIPDPAEPRRGLARMLAALGRWDAARAAAAEAVAHTPADPRAHALLACAAARGADDVAAASAAAAAARLAHATAAPDGSWPAVAAAWRAVDEPAREADAWARAVAADPADPAATLAHAEALARGGQAFEARTALEALHRARPGAADVALALAAHLADADDPGRAVEVLDAVVARDPAHVEALAALAAALVDAGRADAGAAMASRALRLDRDHAAAHAAAACAALAAGLHARAAAHARQAVALEPAGAAARRARALLGRLGEASA